MLVSNAWKMLTLHMCEHSPLDDTTLIDVAVYAAKQLVREQKHPAPFGAVNWLVLRPDPPLEAYPWPMMRISKKHTAKINYGGKQPIPLSENVRHPKIDYDMAHEEYIVSPEKTALVLRELVPSWVLKLEKGRLQMAIATFNGDHPSFFSRPNQIISRPKLVQGSGLGGAIRVVSSAGDSAA
jgi:hypothetical protein